MTMKRSGIRILLIACLLLGIVLSSALTASAGEYSGTWGGNVTWTLEPGTGVLTVSGKGAIKDFSAEGSDEAWYAHRNEIKSIVIQDGITEIGAYAFSCIDGLDHVTLPKGLTYIGRGAFGSNTALGSVEFPEGLVTIDGYAFYGCMGIGEVVIPNSVKTVGQEAFAW